MCRVAKRAILDVDSSSLCAQLALVRLVKENIASKPEYLRPKYQQDNVSETEGK